MADQSGRFFEGLVVGGIFGFLFGMLAAPKSGAELRKQLADGSQDIRRQAGDSIANLQDKTNQTVSDWQNKGEAAVKRAQEVLHTKQQQLVGRMQDTAKHGRAEAEDIESLSSS